MGDSVDLSARITEVVPGSPAAAADVRVGDVVAMVNDRPIRDIIEWHHQVDEAFVERLRAELQAQRAADA